MQKHSSHLFLSLLVAMTIGVGNAWGATTAPTGAVHTPGSVADANLVTKWGKKYEVYFSNNASKTSLLVGSNTSATTQATGTDKWCNIGSSCGNSDNNISTAFTVDEFVSNVKNSNNKAINVQSTGASEKNIVMVVSGYDSIAVFAKSNDLNIYAEIWGGSSYGDVSTLTVGHTKNASSHYKRQFALDKTKQYRLTIAYGTSGSSNKNVAAFSLCYTPATPSCAAADLTADNITSNGDQIVGTGITFSKVGNPASGDTWYWQTSATGTDKTYNASSVDYTTATTAGSYTVYLRAYNSGADCWGTAIGKTNMVIACPFDVYNGENVDKGKTTASGWTINSSSSMALTSGSSNGYSYWYQAGSSSSYVQFDGSMALASGDQIKIQWTHTSANKSLALTINGSSASLTSGGTVTTANTKMEAIYDVTSAITVTSIKLNSSGSSGCIIYQVSIVKSACAEPACSAPVSPTITATPASAAYTEGDNISLTASATGTDGSTTYTWYKGTTWDAASATSSIGSAATFTKNSCVEGDAGTYWCNISNGTGCEVQVSKTITVAASSCTEVVAPTGLAENTAVRTTDKITFTWTAAANASSYDVKLWDNSACTGDPIASDNVTTTSKQFTGLTDGTTYYCKVQSKGDGETYCTDGGTTDAVSGTTATIPSYNVSAVTSTGDNSRGSVSAAASSVKMGGTTTITAVPATGYRVSAWTASGTGVSIDPAGLSHSTTATLTMGTSDVTVTVSFEQIPCIGNEGGTLFSADAITTSDVSFSTGTTEILSTQATVSGGKVYAISGQTDSKKLLTSGGQFSMTNNDTRFHLELNCALRAGDTIKIDGMGGTKNSDSKGLWVSTATSRPGSAPAAVGTNSSESWHTPMLSYVVTSSDEYVGNTDLYVFRAAGATQNFDNVRIIRPAKYAMTFAKGDEGASGEMSEQSVIEKSQVTLPACTFTAPEGKEFDAWVVTKTDGGASITVTDGKFTMPQEAVTLTATWKALTVKYAVTYVLNGPSGDAPTETNKAEGDVFDLAAAPTWSDHVFEGWQWTDDESVTHLEDAEAEFTMPAYAVTFTAQWRLDPQATMSDAQYVIGGSALNMAAKFSSLNTSGAVIFSLKESYEGASITEGVFTAIVAGEYIVLAEQAGDGTYAKGEAEATVEVLESELSDTYIWKKGSGYTGCVASPNDDAPAALYTDITYEGFTGMGRATTDNTECILTLSVKNAYNSLFAIKSICTYGKFEEPAGGQISWDGGSNWEDLAKYTSEGKKEFAPAAGDYPTSFKIKFMGVSKDAGGLYWRNALVTLEAKKAIVSTVIDLTDVKINSTSISAANLSTLKTGPAYALDLADEYVTAPTVKFNKHTVITYDDASEVEKDDVITETAAVNVSGKWEASAEINDITYTVTMAKADAFVVHYYESDGKTLIGSENVAVNGHPTAADITPTPIDYKRVVWKLSGEAVDLDDVTSDVAGTEITLVASYVDAYASSINIEQWVLDNGKNNAAFRAVLDARYFKYANLNDLDSLTAEKNDGDRNYPFLGQKWKLETSEISFLLKEGSTVKARFGNMGSSVNVKIGSADAVELTSGSYANSSPSSSKEYSYTATADVVVKFQGTGTGTVVFKQIMIDEDIASMTLPAIVTYDANGGSFAKTSEKYTGTPLVIGDATPADDDYEFEGWHVGTVEGTKINAAAYEPTKNVTLVAKYVAKPSPFSLSALTYKIGSGDATAVGYVEGTYDYTVKLPYAPSYETITVAYTLADDTSSEKAGAVLSVTSVPGTATFTIVAANTTEKTYTVNFKKEAKDGLEIIGATVTGNTTADMSGLYGGTASVNLNSKKIDNGGYIYITLPSGYTFEETDVLVVNVNNKADIGTKALEITTGVGNIDGAVWKTIAFDDYSTGNNTIALTGIVANQTSIGLKRSSNQNAKINSLKVYRPLNPVLKSITFDGTKIDVTGLTAEETLPYSADLTAVTPEIFWNGAGTAVVSTNEGEWDWGDNTYVLTDKDGDATTYTITLTRATRSSDKSLSSLTVDGNAIALSEGVFDYTYVYPYGTDPATVPVVEAVANDAHASVGDVTQAASTAGTASFTVTAEDETTQDYTVKFQISRVKELVIYDGSTMTDIASRTGSDVATGFSYNMASGIALSGTSYNASWNGKDYTKVITGFKPNDNENNIVSFVIPEDYMAKVCLVGSTNSSGTERKMFIANAASRNVSDAISEDYIITSSTYDAEGFITDFLPAGTYYLGTTDSYRLYELSVTLYSIDYTRTTTPGRLGTICLEEGGTMRGATLYEVAYFNPDNRKIYFDEIIGGEMEPGMPYVFIPEEDNNNQLVVMYGNNVPAAVAGHYNGLYGSFTEALLEKNTVNYIFSANKYWYVNSDEVYVGANRAYLKVAEILGYAGEPEPTSAPGRRRVTMDSGDQAPQITTGLENLHAGDQPVKMLINGKIFILRGEKMYDVTGKLVK